MATARVSQLFAVVVNRDDTVDVVAVDVVKETPQFYIVPINSSYDYQDRRRYALGFSSRISKEVACTSARVALERYMAKRQRDKENAKAVVGQATKQIASANELLMHLPVPVTEAVL